MIIARTYPFEPTRLAFEELKDYLRRVSDQLHVAAEAEKQWVHDHYAGDDDVDDVAMDFMDIDEQYETVFRPLLLQSVVVLTYSQMESELKRFADLLRERRALPTSMSQFKGDVVERSQTFFKTFAIPVFEPVELGALSELTLVRNCIVHNAGVVSGTNKETALRQAVARLNSLSMDHADRIQPTLEYCETQVCFLADVFTRLYAANGLRVA